MNRQCHRWALVLLNSLLHLLFLNHDIIFLFLDHIEKIQVLDTFENIMENGAFAPKEQML